ncbi:MAG: DNA-3-methyladenine glycosylase [Leucobacter sp.]
MQRSIFTNHALEVAPHLLGATLHVAGEDGTVAIRITEVEAYHGVGTPGPYDGGSHSRDRKTERNASMFGPPGHAYVYLNYGMHYALNVVCSPTGTASGVLIRSAEVIEGEKFALRRRIAKRTFWERKSSEGLTIPDHLLARGPGNLTTSLGITRATHDGFDLFASPFSLTLLKSPDNRNLELPHIAQGPRVGVGGDFGGPEFPWRFWIKGDPTVSAFRPGRNAPR